MARLQAAAATVFPQARAIHTLDGVRVEYSHGFGLARPSNTTPVVVFRFEGDHDQALEAILADFRRAFAAFGVRADELPF
jgi:phosphomannomutase/phosphoglucomutase